MTSKQLFSVLVVLLVLLLTASALGALRGTENTFDGDGDVACAADGFVCPNGLVVGRVPPSCKFADCPEIPPGPGDVPGQKMGVLEGIVTLSPTCPVERMPPDPQCAPRPYVTEVQAVRTSDRKVEGLTRTTSEGTFVLDLPAGMYHIRAEGGKVLPQCGETTVTIISGERTHIDISCDTGIR
jgi:hypothetical protein